ncbi:hypothetical protein [Ferrimicrobium acidiphilum]|uniref:hypothetical protein n=1 Tax=Ferrimicrobium acidiphilum TaxID=121039 RepID=UPI0023F4B32E|nr:hypothetical protein [Ferrimicrobium acidiphilum]
MSISQCGIYRPQHSYYVHGLSRSDAKAASATTRARDAAKAGGVRVGTVASTGKPGNWLQRVMTSFS